MNLSSSKLILNLKKTFFFILAFPSPNWLAFPLIIHSWQINLIQSFEFVYCFKFAIFLFPLSCHVLHIKFSVSSCFFPFFKPRSCRIKSLSKYQNNEWQLFFLSNVFFFIHFYYKITLKIYTKSTFFLFLQLDKLIPIKYLRVIWLLFSNIGSEKLIK